MKNFVIALVLSFSSVSVFALEVGDFVSSQLVSAVQESGETNMEESLEAQDGKRYTMIEFMSIYCRPCVTGMPVVKYLAEQIKETTTVKTIIIDRNQPAVMDFIDANTDQLSFPILLDSKRELVRTFKMRYTPTAFIIDETGEIIYKHIGTFNAEEVAKVIAMVK